MSNKNKCFVPIGQEKLLEIKGKFFSWRNNENSPYKIPEELWNSALSLSPYFSVSRISRELSLSYSELKSRLFSMRKNEIEESEENFVELNNSILLPSGMALAEIIKNGNTLRLFSNDCSSIIEAFLKL